MIHFRRGNYSFLLSNMSFSQNFNQPPPGFGSNFLPNQQQQLPPSSFGRATPTNVYTMPPPFNMPPPNFILPPSTLQFNAPPPAVPRFTAPPPNWSEASSSASPNYSPYNSIAQPPAAPPPVLDMFKFPPPPPPPSSQTHNGYGAPINNQLVENRQRQSNQSESSSSSSSYSSNSTYKNNYGRSSSTSSGSNTVKPSWPSSNSNFPNPSFSSRSQSSEPTRDRSNRDNRDSRDNNRDRREQQRCSSRATSERSDYNRKPSYSSARNERSSSSSRSETSRSRKDYQRPGSGASSSLGGGDDSFESERDELLSKWRSNYCEHFDDIKRKLTEMDPITDDVAESWVRSSPSDIYYERSSACNVNATPRLNTLCSLFESDLLKRGADVRAGLDPYTVPVRKRKHKVCRHKCKQSNNKNSLIPQILIIC